MEENASAVPSVDTAVATESDSERLKRLTQQLAEDARPIAERFRAVPDKALPIIERARGPMLDLMVPVAEQVRPLMNDLSPVAQDVRALLVEAVALSNAAASRIVDRLDLHPPRKLMAIVGAGTQRLAGVRLPVARPNLSMPLAVTSSLVAPSVRVPRVSLRIGLPLGAIARRLRPGRWAFRTVAIGIIAVAAANPTVRDAVVEQASATASFVQTVQIPTIELPAIELPAFEMPAIQLPTVDLSKIELPAFQFPSSGPTAVQPTLAPATFELPPLDAYRASFETQAAYPAATPNGTVEWVVALRNTGSVGWYRGVAGAQAALALTDGTEVAVQSTPYVAPGQVGWFVVRFRAPAAPGTQSIALYPRIDGRGELPDLGIFALVTVR